MLQEYMPVWEGELDRKRSPFKSTICHEDLQHIKTIKNTDVKATSLKRLTEIFYKSVMKPVQGYFNFEQCRCLYQKLHTKYSRFVLIRIIRSIT